MATPSLSDKSDPAIVSTGGKAARIGDFAENAVGEDSANLRAAFGQPSDKKKTKFGCVLSWSSQGIKAELTTYGIDLNPCRGGFFVRATLSDPAFETPDGIGVGSSRSSAKKAAVRDCTDVKDGLNDRDELCGLDRGYVLGLHRSECAAARVPSVVAVVDKKEVKALRVLTHGCE